MAEPIVHEKEASLEALVLSAQTGDSEAATRLVMQMMPLVRRQATKYQTTELDVDDLSQEGFIGLLSAVRGFNPEKGLPFVAYASVCVQNSILSALRKSLGAKSLKAQDFVPLDDEILQSPALSLEQQQDLREECERVWQFVATRLSETEQRVLRLFLSGLSYGEIASQIGTNAKSVDNALQRVRAKLKK